MLIGKQIIDLTTGKQYRIDKFSKDREQFTLCNGQSISIYQVDIYINGTYHILN